VASRLDFWPNNVGFLTPATDLKGRWIWRHVRSNRVLQSGVGGRGELITQVVVAKATVLTHIGTRNVYLSKLDLANMMELFVALTLCALAQGAALHCARLVAAHRYLFF
jgi:hypothetical protein